MSEQFTNLISPLTPDEIRLDTELEVLGYTIEWIRWGMLTEDEFRVQLKNYQKAVQSLRDDPHAEADGYREHYRWGHTIQWLSAREELSEKEFYQLLWLNRHQDEIPTNTLLHLLIRSKFVYLSDSQFEYLSHLVVAGGYESLAVEMAVLRRCYKEPWSAEIRGLLLSAVSGRNQAEIIHDLFDKMTKEDFLVLAEHGASKASRNLANEKLNSREFRD